MKEVKMIFNTENGQTSFKTEQIIGKLDGIIVDSIDKCEIIIESEYGYLILHRHEHYGTHYYSIRNRTTTPIEYLTDFPGFEEFNLNEPIIITIRGRKNQEVRVVLRIED